MVTIYCLESEKNKDYSLEKLKKLSKKDLQTICVHEQLTHSGNKEKLSESIFRKLSDPSVTDNEIKLQQYVTDSQHNEKETLPNLVYKKNFNSLDIFDKQLNECLPKWHSKSFRAKLLTGFIFAQLLNSYAIYKENHQQNSIELKSFIKTVGEMLVGSNQKKK